MEILYGYQVHGQALPLIAQPVEEQKYYPQLKVEDGLIDWALPPAELSARFRALNPWVGCYSFLDGALLVLFQKVRLIAAEKPLAGVAPGTILNQRGGEFRVATVDPATWLAASGYRICWGPGYFPAGFSRLLGHWLFRPGRRFCNQS